MDRSLRAASVLLLAAAAYWPAPATGQARTVPSIQRVRVLRIGGQVEIEIEASDRVVPQANMITGPDRLIVDFVNAVPGAQLRNQAVHSGDVKNLRVGLFSKNPPVTRVVLDLNEPQAYQVFPSGKTVIVKVGGNATARAAGLVTGSGSAAALVNASYGRHSMAVPVPPPPPLVVSFKAGLLSISANKANLSEVLFAVHERTGAEIAIPAGAEQEGVVGEFGPGPAPEVLSRLLNGSKFNFLIVNSATSPGTLDRVILSPRPEGPTPVYPSQAQSRVQPQNEAMAEEQTSLTPPAVAEQPAPNMGRQTSPQDPNPKTPPDSDDPN